MFLLHLFSGVVLADMTVWGFLLQPLNDPMISWAQNIMITTFIGCLTVLPIKANLSPEGLHIRFAIGKASCLWFSIGVLGISLVSLVGYHGDPVINGIFLSFAITLVLALGHWLGAIIAVAAIYSAARFTDTAGW